MRSWVTGLAAAAALAATACSGQGEAAKEVRVYNWSDYIDPEILEAFTAETGVKVVYDTFDSNEVLETKVLQGATGYDVVTPSNHNLPRYIAAGAIQPLDKSKLTGLENLDPAVMAYLAPFDPEAKYAVPYMWGTIGIGYNPAEIEKRIPGAKVDSWAFAFDPANLEKLADCGVYWLDASEDMYAVALHYAGRDPNATAPADIAAATEMMLKARPHVRKFHSSEYINALAAGDACLAIGYSGDVIQAQARAEEAGGRVEVAYAVPKEGTQVWFDVFVLPKDAPNPDAAYAFLNYMLKPEVAARATNYVAYANANARATPLVDEAVRTDPNIYPPAETLAKMFVTKAKDQDALREVNRQWTRVQTGR